MRRRQFLASGAALLSVALAGCGAHPSHVLDFEAATTDELVDEVSDDLERGSEEYRLAQAAIEDGPITRHVDSPEFYGTSTVRVDGAVYEVSETEVGEDEVEVYEVSFDFDPEDPTPELGEIALEDLPPVDRQRLDPLISPEPESSGDGYDVTTEWGTAELLGNASVLAPDQQYDVIVDGERGRRYRVRVSADTESRVAYRYEVTEVAPTVEAFAQQLRDRYLFELTGLSEDERSVLEEAIEGAYFENDDAFQSIVDRLREHEGLNVEEFYGTWLAEYEGTAYLAYARW